MFIEKLVPYNKRMELNFRRLLRGKLYIKRNLDPLYITEGINWDFKHHKNPRTYQVYLHSLNFLNDITWSHIRAPKTLKIKKTREILDDWIKKNLDKPQRNLAWNEHAVSNRLINIIFFQLAKKNTEKFTAKEFQNLLIIHAEYLASEKNYKENNHGIMMDNALLCASIYVEEDFLRKKYQSIAMKRLQEAIERDFTEKGTHLENSPEYHKLVRMLFKQTEYILKELKVKIPILLENKLNKTLNYSRVVLKPDLTYPLLGDTGLISEHKLEKSFDNFLDQEAGQCIINIHDKKITKNSKYLVFIAGYSKKTHKHYDDLSFIYYEHGHDIFVDSGKYSYNKNDAIRNYIISPQAHNTIYVENESYSFSNPQRDRELVFINTYIERKEYSVISGVNNLYNNIEIKRTLILTQEGIIFILDEVKGKEYQTYYQNFNLSLDTIITNINKETFLISLANKTYILKTVNTDKNSIRSSLTTGYISEKFGNVNKNNKAIFNKTGLNTSFFTYFHEEKYKIEVKKINLKRRFIIYTCDNKKRKIKF